MPLLFIVLLCAVLIWLIIYLPRLRKKRVLQQPFPDEYVAVMMANIPVYEKMPRLLQQQLQGLVLRFLDDKKFVACGGLKMANEIAVTIAAEACLLLLNRRSDIYPGLRSILVYPAAFVANRADINSDGIVTHHDQHLLGESWSNGRVVLAWDHVQQGAKNFSDGQNVVLHEFAHQLDSQNGSTNGAPLLGGASAYSRWAAVLSKEFIELQDDTRKHRKSLMDHYGATNPAEFFAVATETFFEKPQKMANEHADLFNQLRTFYCVDPREWI